MSDNEAKPDGESKPEGSEPITIRVRDQVRLSKSVSSWFSGFGVEGGSVAWRVWIVITMRPLSSRCTRINGMVTFDIAEDSARGATLGHLDIKIGGHGQAW